MLVNDPGNFDGKRKFPTLVCSPVCVNVFVHAFCMFDFDVYDYVFMATMTSLAHFYRTWEPVRSGQWSTFSARKSLEL